MIRDKAMKIAYHLQRLSDTEFERHDEETFIKACEERAIPAKYMKTIKGIVFSKTVVNCGWPD